MSEAVITDMEAAQRAAVSLIASRYDPAHSAASAPGAYSPVAMAVGKFEFDEEFQTKIAIHAMRNLTFMRQAAHLLKPDYFENAGEAAMVNIALRYYSRYGTVPTAVLAKTMFADDIRDKVIRSDIKPVAIEAFKACFNPAADLSDGEPIAERVAQFVRHQAMQATILESVELLEKGDMDKISQKVKAACEVGVNTDGDEYDYFTEIESRTAERADKKAGKLPPTGITTGFKDIDALLYHMGWGRKELAVLLGGPKSGKTTALINFAKAASLAGYNVLYASCEVASRIIAERMDATMSDTEVKLLVDRMHDVAGKIKANMPRAGVIKIHEYPSGTLSPSQLKARIERYKSPRMMPDGTVAPPIQFDLIIVDYADIMAPDFRTQDTIENSKSIYLALRALAAEENVAMLTATQGNREGSKAVVLKGEHVADDYNKVRTVDIMISINVTDEERANGEARLYFAASRNQEGGMTVFIKQELAKMKFIASIVRIE